ncbi:unnamed protein product, partial [marine sediment metagenome]
IDIPVGAYKPTFSKQTDDMHGSIGANIRFYQFVSIGALIIALVMAVLWFTSVDNIGSKEVAKSDLKAKQNSQMSVEQLEGERQAMFDKSPGSLEAYDLTRQARMLIFPPLDPVRSKSALDLFSRAIKLDAEYYGPYAGAAQVLAFMAFVAPPDQAKTYMAQAISTVKKAKMIDPTRPWVQSALAWVAYVNGDFEDSLEYSNRAVALARGDWLIIDFHAVISMLNGNFEDAMEIASQSIDSEFRSSSVRRNVLAVSSFHLGRFEKTIE